MAPGGNAEGWSEEGWYILDLVPQEFLLALLQIAREAFVELFAALDGERVVDWLPCEFAQDVCCDVEAEYSR